MLEKIINAIKEFFASLFGSPTYELTTIENLTLEYLKNYRTGQGTEIIVMKAAAALNNPMIKKVKNFNSGNAKYVFAEWDPQKEEVLNIEGAKNADSKIASAVENANNGVLVIQ